MRKWSVDSIRAVRDLLVNGLTECSCRIITKSSSSFYSVDQ